jgi:hypothetical protein
LISLSVLIRLLQLEPGVPLPSPNQLKRKIIIKNKKKHQHHRTHKDLDKGAAGGASASAAAIGSANGSSFLPQGNGEIPRPRLEKEESKDSITEEEDAIIHGSIIAEDFWLLEFIFLADSFIKDFLFYFFYF